VRPLTSATDPGSRTTSYAYDARGRQFTVTLPDTSQTATTYTPRGEVASRSGSQTYPVSHSSEVSMRTAVTRRSTEASLGKSPATRVRERAHAN